MDHKIREHMAAVDGEQQLSNDVEIDEAFFGGYLPRSEVKPLDNKIIVMGMLERDSDVMTKVVPSTLKTTLQNEIIDNAATGSTLHTDEHAGYTGIKKLGYKHDFVTHRSGEYVDSNVHINTMKASGHR